MKVFTICKLPSAGKGEPRHMSMIGMTWVQPPPTSPSGEGKDVACGGEQEGCWGDWGKGALRGFFMQLCIAFMLSSQ